MEKKDRDELKNEIDSLINSSLNSETLPNVKTEIPAFNSQEVSLKAKSNAQKLVLSCLRLYFDEKVIDKNEFMQAKSAVTTANITTLFRQIKIAEHFIDKIVNDIDNGNLNPRIFEVAAGIQSNIIDMLKNVQLHVISMQEEYRRLQSEMPKSEIQQTVLKDSNGNKIYTNSKSLLKDLNDDDLDDVSLD